MEKLKSPVPSPFKGKDITVLAGKFKHMALNTPLRFSVQALRPHSKNTARFGSLSHHSFFSRHNPHPQRVTHIQGLNGAPVCTVNDEWTILPPHPMIKSQLHTHVLGVLGIQRPIGDPQPLPIPRLSVGSLSDAWREELRELAARVTAVSFAKKEKKETILELLCQILQTDSLAAIQQWLLTAGQRDKDLVMGFLQIATANLHLESQELATNMEVRLPAHLSPNASDFTSRLHSFGRNHSNRVFVATQKQECIPEEEKPVLIGTAEILQLHSDTNEKQNQPARTN
ncbi:protein TBATA isoform X5 [Sceloporus undulatus]|uniref:protein TBATA isoform X5 n=1 Tax=Sceloporus undulatus TaxID=8520 RepID=UPI001C4A78C3|nr:protein TBATA isoform X5 [Sceloporus undulatus]